MRNVNHIQDSSTSSSKESHIKVVITKSQTRVEPYPIIDENNSDPCNNELKNMLNEYDVKKI